MKNPFKRKPKLLITVAHTSYRKGREKTRQLEVKSLTHKTQIFSIKLDNFDTVQVKVTQL